MTKGTRDWNLNLSCLSNLTAIFPGGPGLAAIRMSPFWILPELRMMQMVVTTLQSKHHHHQTIIHLLHMPDALPVTQPTVLEN